ncbi:MAG: tRNA pseudouridine(55) synthase TruB, partial [Candidatus Omnitrophica bacterium CG12_big_fil_rev_8_21_14_0_65_50_5]
MNGILIIDKPSGVTSHDVVQNIRRKFHMRRVGHAGTLDPLATGILILLLGESTKLSDRFSDFDKTYLATMRLGTTTETADIDGKILVTASYSDVTQQQIQDIMKSLEGEQDQVPPMYSAVKFNGKKLYELARKGIHVERPPRRITI